MIKVAQEKKDDGKTLKTKKMEMPFRKKKPVEEQTLEERAEADAKKALNDEARESHRAMVQGNSLVLVEGKNDKAIADIRNMLEFLASQQPPELSYYVEKYKVKTPSDFKDAQKKRIDGERKFFLWVRKFAENILKAPSQPTELRSEEIEDLDLEDTKLKKAQSSLFSKISALSDDLQKEKKKFEERKEHSKSFDDYSDEEIDNLNKQLNQAVEKQTKSFGWERVFKYKGEIYKAYKLTRAQLELIEKLYYKMKEVSLKRQDLDYKKEDWEKAPKKEAPKSEWLVNFQKRQEEKKKEKKEEKLPEDLDFGDSDKKTAKSLKKIKVAQFSLKAALNICAKCSYGFIGRKPDEHGNMIKMDPSDPEYSPTEPCPNCGFVAIETTSGDEKKEIKDKEGFGEKYYTIFRPEDSDIDTIGGPFYDKSEADSHREVLIEKIINSPTYDDWLGFNYSSKSQKEKREEIENSVSTVNDLELSKEIEYSDFPDVVRPSQQIKQIDEHDKYSKKIKLKELADRLPTKDKNVANNQSRTKKASAENESHVPLLQVRSLIGVAADLEKLIDPSTDLEDWVGSKIARALSDITDLKNYLEYHTVEGKYNTPNTFDIGPVSLDSIASRVNRIKSIIKKSK
jgi:hypothetical protein